MNNTEAILDQTVEQLERMNAALISLRRELLPSQPRKFAILAEGPLEEIRRLRDEIEALTAKMAASEAMPV
jgi:hypothetical protein